RALLRGPDNAVGTADDRVPTVGIFDRGNPSTANSTQNTYINNTTGLRAGATLGQVFDLGGGVTLKAVAVDGSVQGLTSPIAIDKSDENQRGLVLLLQAPREGEATFKA